MVTKIKIGMIVIHIIGWVVILASFICFLVGEYYKYTNKVLFNLMLDIALILIIIGALVSFLIPCVMCLINKYCCRNDSDQYDPLISDDSSGQLDGNNFIL